MALHEERRQPSLESQGGSKDATAKVTLCVLLSCICAASGGFMAGYDMVIAGGIGIMDGFLEKFYPMVFEEKKRTKQDVYCKYNNEVFQLFSSSLYLGALLTTFVASFVSRKFGRKSSMLIAGVLFICGTLLCTLAINISMILSGRTLVGFGIGFSNQAISLYLSEIAPPQFRGRLFYLFGINVACGFVIGSIVNFLAEKVDPWGWRISFGVQGIPAILFTLFSLLLFETPTSLIQQGHHAQAKHVLAKIRGSNEIDREYQNLVNATYDQDQESPIKILWTRKEYVPQLVIGMAIPFFQQVVGSDALHFYGVFIFKVAGFGNGAALYSALIIGSTSFTSLIVAILLVDHIGRRKLLLGASFAMLTTMVVVGLIFALSFTNSTQRQEIGHMEGIELVVTLSIFTLAFAGSLGPLAWLIPSEIFSLEVRSLGLSVATVVNMLFKFIIAQTFLSMLCALEYGTFILCSCFSLLLMIFVALFLPETKGLSLHAMQEVWESHWFWKRFVNNTKHSDGLRGTSESHNIH